MKITTTTVAEGEYKINAAQKITYRLIKKGNCEPDELMFLEEYGRLVRGFTPIEAKELSDALLEVLERIEIAKEQM